MMIPVSGRNGFMLFGGIEIPLYSWIFSTLSKERPTYRTSNSLGYPKRNTGVVNELITIRGVDHNSPFNGAYSSSDTYFNFILGWNDFVAMNRRAIGINAMLLQERIDINYFSDMQPSHIWTVNMQGVINSKSIQTNPIIPFEDNILCSYKKCDKTITTTDSALNSGLVKHVRRVSITNIIDRQLYMTSNSNNRAKPITGKKDRLVEIEIQGDFDYWFNAASSSEIVHNYKFFYGPIAATDFWLAANMKIINIGNLICNMQTAELIQATVYLGASY